ncbi:ParB/RepB/Spo0J family partition protein, partial [Streptomyces capuensis]|uniref:ParB/RepB/Spo0J family partition protein n=1 Tax=Streptomyces capuensis TaxID=1464056 RepID=UPI001F29AB7A
MTSRQSAADRVGASASFDRASRGRSSRGAIIAAVTGETAPTDNAPLLALDDIADNPENPREVIDTDSAKYKGLLSSIEEIGVTSPITVCSAAAFLSNYPQHQDDVGDQAYVLLAGHRRVSAAREAGLVEVPAYVDDSGATDPLLWALAENGNRENLNPIEQARALYKCTAKPPLGKGLSQGKVAKA